ncbi:toll-like receptor 13 [Melanotaenia boesemani]|uniref:toll-like receptor 13 n=1 Tax=Melanotaenia boesemani TaxID=1250792 RepID=UPI001C04EE5A|nr:toll-like receptor 13 [Melanotaenia boesemani]
MPNMGGFSPHFIFGLLSLLLHTNLLLAYSLKNCSISYRENPSDDVSLDCSSKKLVAIPDDIPKNAVSVLLFNNLLERINKGFSGMSKLRNLSLYSNHITHVDDGSFIDLVALETLRMSMNKLTNLTCNMFQGLSNLTLLDLSDNEIKFIHISAFQFLTSLQILDLGSNKLQEVTEIQPVLQLPQIQCLHINSNKFSSFQTKNLLLNSSSNLRVLDISSNELERFSITTPIFPYLQRIQLSQTGQGPGMKWNIPDKSFLRNITQLYLNNPMLSFKDIQKVLWSLDSLMHLRLNYMTRWFNKGLFATVCKMPTLRRLELFYNHLGNLTLQLSPCSDLRELDLSLTTITELPKGSIQSMKKLHALSLESNLLTKVPDDIRTLASLEILSMMDNLISDLTCEDFVNTTNLTKLSLNTNHIAKLNRCAFENLTNLKILDLSNNLLWRLDGTFKTTLQKLEVLDISQNSIAILQGGDFQGLQSLKLLNVKSDHVTRVKRRTFKGLHNMESLIVSLPLEYEPSFNGLHHLKDLTIHFKFTDTFRSSSLNDVVDYIPFKSLNRFTVICSGYHYGFPLDVPIGMLHDMQHLEDFTAVNVYLQAPECDTFQYNYQLKSLTFAQTDLSDLGPELFQTIPNLQVLNLTQCKLKSLDFLVQANLTALKYLKLSYNEITIINETAFQFLPSLTYLDLNNNPFTCDCSNAGFIQWVKKNSQTYVVNAHQYTCSFPVALQGSMLLDIDVQSCWMVDSFLYFISSTCLVVLTLMTSFFYQFLRWQLVYAFHLLLAFLYDSRKKKKVNRHQFDAFVSYNIHDEEWVFQEMLPVLEGEQGWRLCLHHRDFQPGKPIIENITDAIYGSRKTICVISRHYLQSEWCSREIQMASFRLFDEKKDVLILLFLEEIPSHQLAPHFRMRKLIKKRSYLSWPQAAQHPGLFWQNVQRALQTEDTLNENTDPLTGERGC